MTELDNLLDIQLKLCDLSDEAHHNNRPSISLALEQLSNHLMEIHGKLLEQQKERDPEA